MADWVKVVNSLPAHPKILRAGDRAAWLYVCGLCYANEHLTDGYIAADVLIVAAPGVKAPEKLAASLVDVGLWHAVEGGWQVHDYEHHQRTSAQVKDIREKDRRRKRKAESDDTLPTDSARNPDGIQPDSVGEGERIPPDTYADARSQEKRREEKEPPTPLTVSVECEEWLLHYEQTTGHDLPAQTTKAFKAIVESYGARRAEGYPADDLTLATVGAHADEYRRTNGYDTAESILRPTKIAALIAKGKLRTGGGRSGSSSTGSSADLARQFHGEPAA